MKKSILAKFEQLLSVAFPQLHPKIQSNFSLKTTDEVVAVMSKS